MEPACPCPGIRGLKRGRRGSSHWALLFGRIVASLRLEGLSFEQAIFLVKANLCDLNHSNFPLGDIIFHKLQSGPEAQAFAYLLKLTEHRARESTNVKRVYEPKLFVPLLVQFSRRSGCDRANCRGCACADCGAGKREGYLPADMRRALALSRVMPPTGNFAVAFGL